MFMGKVVPHSCRMEPRVSWKQPLPGPVPCPIIEQGSQISFWMSINNVLYPQAIRWKHFSDQCAYEFHFSTEARQIKDVSLSPLLCVIIIICSQYLLPFVPTFPSPRLSLGFMWKFYLEVGRHSIL